MIRGRYGLLIAGVVVAMLSVAAGAGLFMAYVPLPDPSIATRHDLLRWLVLRDLAKEPMEIRLTIVSRLDTEFENVSDMGSTIEKLEGYRRQMLWHNVTVLLEPWLLSKVDQYSLLPASQQGGYIDRFLDRAEQWNKIGAACLKNSTERGSQGTASVSKMVLDQIEQCGKQAAPEKRRQIDAFMIAVQGRWLWRQLPSFNLFGRPAKEEKKQQARPNPLAGAGGQG